MLAVGVEYGEEEDGEHVQRQALASSLPCRACDIHTVTVTVTDAIHEGISARH